MASTIENSRLNDDERETAAGGVTASTIDPAALVNLTTTEVKMSNEMNSKRLSEDELEAIAGGVTPPTIDPSALQALMHSTVGLAVAGGGAFTVDTHTLTHTDNSAPTINEQTHIIVPANAVFGEGSLNVPTTQSAPGPVVSGTSTLSGTLNLHIDTPPPQTIEIMHFDNPTGGWTTVIPTVSAQAEPPATGPHSALSDSFKVGS